MIKTKLCELERAARGGYNLAPVRGEIYSDILTPVQAYKKLCCGGASLLFESAEGGERQARYSFIGCNPKAEIFISDGVFTLKRGGRVTTKKTSDPDGEIRSLLSGYKSPKEEDAPPFCGGLAGYFCYEYYKYGERVDMPAGAMGDARLFLFDEVVAFDNFKRKIIITVNVKLFGDLSERYQCAVNRIEEICDILRRGGENNIEGLKLLTPFSAAYSEDDYCGRVKRAKKYICEGDIFQCVPSNRWTAECEGSLFNAYRVMRVNNPSPYMIYLRAGECEIAGASPETLVKLNGKKVLTFPIAGTRRRGTTAAEDEELERELKADEKENAEHDMLVDLGRNDLGKISEFGSVQVEDYKKICRYSHVMHVTSCVTGTIKSGCDALSALRATLPAGTLSGAPKKRAVEIIRELEDYKPRGLYGGAVGYVSFSGDGDFCIAIRTAVREGNKVTAQAGGGVVYGSVPQNEFLESVNKSAAVREALQQAAEADL